MHPLLFPQCLQSRRYVAAGTTIAIPVVMALRLPLSREPVVIAVLSAGLAIGAAWHFERSEADYQFLRQLEKMQETRQSPRAAMDHPRPHAHR